MLVLAALLCGPAWGQVPSYSATGVVNASDYSPGPFAPNAVLSLFGSNLSYPGPTLISQDSIGANRLPTQLAGVEVLVDNSPAPLLFVSAGQINFLLPSSEIPGMAKLQVVRQSLAGPAIFIPVALAGPALFPVGKYAIAQDWNASSAVATPDAPAHSGDMIVLYATGLGDTQPHPNPGEIPATAANLLNLASLKLLLNGVAVDSTLIKYAGLTPRSAGLYQINFILPSGIGFDPEIRVSVAGQVSAPGIKLAVR